MADVYQRTHRIDDQHAAYRKGMVLGLTMAEVGILIIFVLLLLLVFVDLERARLTRRLPNKEQLVSLREKASTLESVAKALQLPQDAPPEDFVRLVKLLESLQKQPDAKSALSAAQVELAAIRQVRELLSRVAQVARDSGSKQLAKSAEQQAFRIANQEGQIAALQRKLAATGLGSGERSCWARPDGSPDFLFDVVLASDGVRMRDHVNPLRVSERGQLPPLDVESATTMSESTFRSVAYPYFRYSQTNNCRFFVVVFDATASHEKARYKSLLRTVEGFFYKRLDDGSAPF